MNSDSKTGRLKERETETEPGDEDGHGEGGRRPKSAVFVTWGTWVSKVLAL